MKKGTIRPKKLFCFRCGYKWIPRSENKPKYCPNCHSPYYNTPRRRRKK